MRSLPPLAVRILKATVRDPVAREGLLGDLEERFRLVGGGPAARGFWLMREVCASVFHYTVRRRLPGAGGIKGEGFMDVLAQDLRFALRTAVRRPGFSTLIVLTLALGIGSTTAVFSVVNGLLLEPLPYEAAERLSIINQRTPEGFTASVSLPNYRDWKERARSFDRFSAILPTSVSLGREDGTRIIETGLVHGGFFETLGVESLLGRVFTESESEPGAAPVAVLSHALWSNELGADPSVVGRDVRLRGESWTVVGVMPPEFQPYGEVLLYLPMGYFAPTLAWDDRGTGSGTEIVARLAEGTGAGVAQAELETIAGDLQRELGGEMGVGNLTLLRRWYLGDTERQVVLLMGAVALVLLVACANVANLLLVRGAHRGGEIAVRAALGAGRTRVYRQLFTESLMYGLAGGVAGAAVGLAQLDVLVRAVSDSIPAGFADRIAVDGSVLGFTALIALLTAVGAGFVPALRSARSELADALRDSTRTVGGGGTARNALVAAEVALSMVLLVGAGLLIQSLARLQNVDRGFDGSDVVTLRVAGVDTPTREVWTGFLTELRDRARGIPGVIGTASSNHFPLSGNSWEMLYRDEGTPPGERGESVLLTMVSPDFFDTYDVEILEGRGFTDADRWGGDPVALVDETLAAARWPGESAIGRLVTFEQTRNAAGEVEDVWRTVVGVVGHVRHYELANPARIEAYTPLAQSAAWGFTTYLSVRAANDPGALVPAIRSLVAELDPDVALYRIRTMESVIEDELGVYRALRELFTVFAALTLLLGAVGIYSVVSHATALRVREIGVRIALGGAPRSLVRSVVADSLTPVAIGLVAGGLAAAFFGRLLGSFLFEVRPADPVTLGGAAALLLAVAAVSAWIPARRAAGVEPTLALRAD